MAPNPSVEVMDWLSRARPLVHQAAQEIQPFGRLVRMPIALGEHACSESVANFNQLLADTMTLRDMYKKPRRFS